MIQRVVEMTLSYPNELETAFENIKNGEQTVAKADLVNLFRKLELEENFIDLIVTELSLCSDDMEHLNFLGYFERFYIEEGEFKDGDAISEKQSEESEPSHRESKLRGDKKSLKPISQPVDKAEDSGLDIIEDGD